jgi:hypothetical protein
MRCETFELIASAYVDQELAAHEVQESRAHLAICPLCRKYLKELEETSLFFKASPMPEVPRELHGYVMTAIERRVSGDLSLGQRIGEWMEKMNPRPFSYATGVVVSVLLFAVTLAGFKPIPVSDEDRRLSSTAVLLAPPPAIVSSGAEFNVYNNLPANIASLNDETYEMPQMNNVSMVSFSHLAFQRPGDESMRVLVKVETDGRAEVVHVLDDPKDPMVVEQFWWNLSNPTFKPATMNGQPVATQMIMLIEKMDVGG